MQRGAVVVHHQIADLPVVQISPLLLRGEREQFLQQRTAFGFGHAVDVRGVRADVERAASVFRIGTDDGLRHRRKALIFFLVGQRDAVVAARVGVVVDGGLAVEKALALVGQRVVRRAQAGELRLAAFVAVRRRACSSEALAGTFLNELSECQLRWPSR